MFSAFIPTNPYMALLLICCSELSTRMDCVFKTLRRRLFCSRHSVVLLEAERERLKQTIRSLVIHGENNSLLIIGRRGAGKRSVSFVSSYLTSRFISRDHEKNFLFICSCYLRPSEKSPQTQLFKKIC